MALQFVKFLVLLIVVENVLFLNKRKSQKSVNIYRALTEWHTALNRFAPPFQPIFKSKPHAVLALYIRNFSLRVIF